MADNQNKLTLTIDDECIFQTKYERVEDFEGSMHRRVYWKAYDCLIDIIDTQTKLLEDNAKTRNFNANNIIAFEGERGTGKTTCMRNFRRSLRNVSEDTENRRDSRVKFYFENSDRSDKEMKRAKKLNSYFELAGVVDPSLFTAHNSLLEIVIAQMFKKFMDKDSENLNLQKKQELAIKFERVYRNIRIIYSNKEYLEKESIDNLESLEMLSNAISFKEDMQDLVENYIDYMKSDRESKGGFLVIAIDDIDVNLSIGERMIEDIRKYLTIPRVIILLAVKIEQLKETINESYLKDIKNNIAIMKTTEESDNNMKKHYLELKDKAERYLIKVIPINRRICVEDFTLEDVKLQLELSEYTYSDGLKAVNGRGVKEVLAQMYADISEYHKYHQGREIEGELKDTKLCCNLRLLIELVTALFNAKKLIDNNQVSKVDMDAIQNLLALMSKECTVAEVSKDV